MAALVMLCLPACAPQHVKAVQPAAPAISTPAPVIIFSRLPKVEQPACIDHAGAWKTYALKLEGLLGITPEASRPNDETH